MTNYMRTNCQDKVHCDITNIPSYITSTSAPDQCKSMAAQFFIQTACLVPTADIADREIKGLALACSAVFVSLFVLNYLDYIKKTQENNYVEWDVKTITSGDYTIEFDITASFFAKYVDQVYEDHA